MVFMRYRGPRILLLGLGDLAKGDAGLGILLARSLREDFEDVDVGEMEVGGRSFLELFHDYDVVIMLTAITYCSAIGQLHFGGPYSLAAMVGESHPHAEALEKALSYARLTGDRIPRLEVISVCVPDVESKGAGLSPALKPKYPAILAAARAGVGRILKEVLENPAARFGVG